MNIKELISQMTLEEKVSLCTGKNLWETEEIERLGIPSITLTDGPYGVIKREKGFFGAIPSTCFPTSSAMSSSWDVDLVHSIGKAIGEECQTEGVGVLLGPGLNIQRNPLGGRNFEYYSEDPVLNGEVGTAFVDGVQSQGVGACVKHFAANNQEYHRTNVNNIIDERTLREIYLPSFEKVIKSTKPYAVMAAYNKINGTYCTENKYLLTDILREQWNFKGVVLSDWYAINSISEALKAGLDLEMPYSHEVSSKKILEAVNSGLLDEKIINDAVEYILKMVFKVVENEKSGFAYSKKEHNDLARRAASNCIVLLKNEEYILPIKRKKTRKRKIAVIGEYAKNPRIQGEGSAHVTPTTVEIPYDEIVKLAGSSLKVSYSKGYDPLNEGDSSLINDAKRIAKDSDISILFVGTPESYDEEGHDRTTIDLPKNQVVLIEEVSKIQENVIVVVNNGSPIVMEAWHNKVKAIVEGWLCGQGFGGAIAEILFGLVNPSGKLSSTFPIQLSDNPTYLDFVDPENNLQYKEGIFVGYRYYDKKNMEVQFPFGYGLSYTSFQYSDLRLSSNNISENDTLEVRLKVKNIGEYFGKETVQLYVKDLESSVQRPVKELKAFAKILLAPGEEKEVKFLLNKRDFAFYDIYAKDWVVESGMFEILIGKSSRDICLVGNVYLKGYYKAKMIYNRETLIGDFLLNDKTKIIVESLLKKYVSDITSDEEEKKILITSFEQFPIKLLLVLSKNNFTEDMLEKIIEQANK